MEAPCVWHVAGGIVRRFHQVPRSVAINGLSLILFVSTIAACGAVLSSTPTPDLEATVEARVQQTLAAARLSSNEATALVQAYLAQKVVTVQRRVAWSPRVDEDGLMQPMTTGDLVRSQQTQAVATNCLQLHPGAFTATRDAENVWRVQYRPPERTSPTAIWMVYERSLAVSVPTGHRNPHGC